MNCDILVFGKLKKNFDAVLILTIITGLFTIITYFDRPSLYCSSKNLRRSVTEPTTFCVLAGKTDNNYSNQAKEIMAIIIQE